MIKDLIAAYDLKDEKRTGWELRNVEEPESVADHSWGTAFLCLIHAEKEDVDTDKAVKMAVVHDLAEAKTGDIPYRKAGEKRDDQEKQQLETRAINIFSKKFKADNLEELWQEYEERETHLAKFVKDMDMIDMCLTALKYEEQSRYDPSEEHAFDEYENMDEFFATTRDRLNTETGEKLFREIEAKYQQALEE